MYCNVENSAVNCFAAEIVFTEVFEFEVLKVSALVVVSGLVHLNSIKNKSF